MVGQGQSENRFIDRADFECAVNEASELANRPSECWHSHTKSNTKLIAIGHTKCFQHFSERCEQQPHNRETHTDVCSQTCEKKNHKNTHKIKHNISQSMTAKLHIYVQYMKTINVRWERDNDRTLSPITYTEPSKANQQSTDHCREFAPLSCNIVHSDLNCTLCENAGTTSQIHHNIALFESSFTMQQRFHHRCLERCQRLMVTQ